MSHPYENTVILVMPDHSINVLWCPVAGTSTGSRSASVVQIGTEEIRSNTMPGFYEWRTSDALKSGVWWAIRASDVIDVLAERILTARRDAEFAAPRQPAPKRTLNIMTLAEGGIVIRFVTDGVIDTNGWGTTQVAYDKATSLLEFGQKIDAITAIADKAKGQPGWLKWCTEIVELMVAGAP